MCALDIGSKNHRKILNIGGARLSGGSQYYFITSASYKLHSGSRIDPDRHCECLQPRPSYKTCPNTSVQGAPHFTLTELVQKITFQVRPSRPRPCRCYKCLGFKPFDTARPRPTRWLQEEIQTTTTEGGGRGGGQGGRFNHQSNPGRSGGKPSSKPTEKKYIFAPHAQESKQTRQATTPQ